MKTSIIKRFSELKTDKPFGKWRRDDEKAPFGWPSDDINEIENLLNGMRFSSSAISKKLSGLIHQNHVSSRDSQIDFIPNSLQNIMNSSHYQSESSGYASENIMEKALDDMIVENNANSSQQNFNSPENGDLIKNFKRTPEAALAQAFFDASERLSNIQPVNEHIYLQCGQVACKLASNKMLYSSKIEEEVIQRLQMIKENSSSSGPVHKARLNLLRVTNNLKSLNERINRLTCQKNPETCNGNTTNLHSSNASIDVNDNITSVIHSNHRISSSDKSLSSDRPLSTHESLKSSQTILSDPGNSQASSINGSQTISQINSTSNPNTNNNNTTSSNAKLINDDKRNKLDQLLQSKEELEAELVSLKEVALQEFFKYEGKSFELNMQAMLQLVTMSQEYYQSCANILKNLQSHLEKNLDGKKIIPIFNRPLKEHVETYNYQIAYPLHLCISALDKPTCLNEEGLFRMAGSKKQVDTLSSAINVLRGESIINQYDSFVIADTLKQYLRSLPVPLLTGSYRNEWAKLIMSRLDPTVESIRLAVDKLDDPEMYNLLYLLMFLNKYSLNEKCNKMSTYSLAIIFAPTLLPQSIINADNDFSSTASSVSQISLGKQEKNHLKFNRAATIIERMITDFRRIFPLSAIRELESYPKLDFINNNDLKEELLDAKVQGLDNSNCHSLSTKRHSGTSENMTKSFVKFFKTLPSRRSIIQNSVPKFNKISDTIIGSSRSLSSKKLTFPNNNGGANNINGSGPGYSGPSGRRKLLLIKSLSQISSPSLGHFNSWTGNDSVCDSNDDTSPSEKETHLSVLYNNAKRQNYQKHLIKEKYLQGNMDIELEPESLSNQSSPNKILECHTLDRNKKRHSSSNILSQSNNNNKTTAILKKSVYADVYDTLFALQSLNNNYNIDYLEKLTKDVNLSTGDRQITCLDSNIISKT